jgi:hypothetical protein
MLRVLMVLWAGTLRGDPWYRHGTSEDAVVAYTLQWHARVARHLTSHPGRLCAVAEYGFESPRGAWRDWEDVTLGPLAKRCARFTDALSEEMVARGGP